MMGRQVEAEPLFYDFNLACHVQNDHLLRRLNRVVDLSAVRIRLTPCYRTTGRPSVHDDH